MRVAIITSMLVAGGVHSASTVTGLDGTTYSYSWRTLPESMKMPVATSDAPAVAVDGKVLIAGGCTEVDTTNGYCSQGTKDAYIFDPAAETPWTKVASMPRKRYRHAVAAVGQKIYYVGGVTVAESLIPEVDVFDMAAKTWSTLDSKHNMPTPTTDPASFAIGSNIYFTGGYDPASYVASKATWKLDTTATGASDPLAWAQVADATITRGDTIGINMNGKGYVFGGFTDTDGFAQSLGDLEVYNEADDTWKALAKIPAVRGDKAAVVLHGLLHAMGGEKKIEIPDPNDNTINITVSAPIREVEVYNPVTGKWQSAGQTPTNRFRTTAAAVDNTIYIFGGQGDRNGDHFPLLDTVEAFEEVPKPGAAMRVPSFGAVAALVVAAAVSMAM